MYYKISHQTKYVYNQPVFLKPHLIRLLPRSDAWQKLHNFTVNISPEPTGLSNIVDLDGNQILQTWFTQPTEHLDITVTSELETLKTNPFDYLLDSSASYIPFEYPSSLLEQLRPYLQPYSFTFDPVAITLAQEILIDTKSSTLAFLFSLNQKINQNCAYMGRETGEPWPPGVTWHKKQGSCRDYSVLFIEVCRVLGIPARFVSGYNQGDRDQQNRDLHAWVEVYLPGGGWRGYDPTLGLAVADGHITLVASAIPSYASPVVGAITPVQSILETGKPPQSQMKAEIAIKY